ncbi:MAG: hypothetical protein ACKORG_05875 [Actinomycetota bacterium]
MPPKVLALAIAVPLAVGALAGCGGSDGATSSTPPASTATARAAAAADFTMVSEMPDPVPVGATEWGTGSEWVPLASPGNINGSAQNPKGIVLTAAQPVAVPIETKDSRELTFVLKILDERVTVKMQGSSCTGLRRAGGTVFSSSVQLPGARLTCTGPGFRLRPIPPPA